MVLSRIDIVKVMAMGLVVVSDTAYFSHVGMTNVMF